MADTELLPCPFCGGAARIQSNRDWHRLYADHDDECVFDADDHVLMYPAQPGYLIQIAEDWNRRAALASRPAEVDDEGLPPLPKATWLGMHAGGGDAAYGYTAEQFRQGQRDAVAADRARREKLPANAEEMVAFIGSHYNSMRDDKPDPNYIVYELTVHDLLSAFRWWFDEFELEDEPSHTTNKEK